MNKFYFKYNKNNQYPNFPYNPDKDYAEFKSLFCKFDVKNHLYSSVRDLFVQAGYDSNNLNNTNWNPFRGFVKNNDSVVIKPNLVLEEKKDLIGTNCITTHASIIRPIIDYLILLQKIDKIKFEITVADVPIQSGNFNEIICQNGLKDLISYYWKELKIKVKLLDLRNEIAIIDNDGFIKEKQFIENDPLGYTNVHLDKSFLDDIIQHAKKFSIGSYNDDQTYENHSALKNHFYQIPNTILKSDFIINIPKIKTHQKAGVTIAMKNLIGINGDKSWIPHYRKGSPKFSGDEFSNNKYYIKYINRYVNRLFQGKSKLLWQFSKYINKKFIKPVFFSIKNQNQELKKTGSVGISKFIMSGAWYGNDTLWRPILDLNKLIFYVDKEGKMTNRIQRKYMCISDGIVAADGNGPLDPKPKKIGLITLSENPVINDLCCTRMLGFEWRKIPQLSNSIKLEKIFNFDGDIEKMVIFGSTNGNKFKKYEYEKLPNFKFNPPPGWINHIELEKNNL